MVLVQSIVPNVPPKEIYGATLSVWRRIASAQTTDKLFKLKNYLSF